MSPVMSLMSKKDAVSMKFRSSVYRPKLMRYAIGLTLIGALTVLLSAVLFNEVAPGNTSVSGQEPQATGMINEVKPSLRQVTVNPGVTLSLSVELYGLQDVQDQSLGSEVVFNWSATGGQLPPDEEGNTSVRYTAPDNPGNYVITATAGSNCRKDCSARITVVVRRPGSDDPDTGPAQNPPGPIPEVLNDSDGNQYAVFAPEEGGTFDGGDFYISVSEGVVPNGEFIGVRMFDDGNASNAGMSGHRYTLSGTKYTVTVVDAQRVAISSYQLDDVAAICIPVPAPLRPNISEVELLALSADGVSLTRLSSSVKVGGSLTLCGYASILPVSVAAGLPGTPPMPEPTVEPEPALPVTGGTAPASSVTWMTALAIGAMLIAVGLFAVIRRRRIIPAR